EHGSDDGEVLSARLRAETARDFLSQLHHTRIAFGLVVGEWHVSITQEAQHIVAALIESHEEVVADTPWLVTAALPATERRLCTMEGEALRQDDLVAACDASHQAWFEWDTALARQVDYMAGAAQQNLHLACPVFFLDFDQR